MKTLIPLVLGAFIFTSCSEPTPVVITKKPAKTRTVKAKKSDNPEDFRANEKPATYSR